MTKAITELTNLTTLASADEFVVVDVSEPLSADKTKKASASTISKFITPAVYTTVIALSPLVACSVGDSHIVFPIPALISGWILSGIKGWVNTAGTTGTMAVQIRNSSRSLDMLSTKLTFASGSLVDDGTAVINTSNDDVSTGDIIAVDIDAVHTTPALGLFIEFKWSRAE